MSKQKHIVRPLKPTTLEKIYTENKAKIDEAYSYLANPKAAFFVEMQSISERQNLTAAESAKKLFKSEIFTPEQERFVENMLKGLRKDKAAYDKWRKVTRHQKIDKSKIVFKGYDSSGVATYEYGGYEGRTIRIVISNSPSAFDVVRI